MAYNPLSYETNWQVSTAEKGTRFSVIRGNTGGDVACVPYGLTRDCKALATMISATPDLYQALNALFSGLVLDPNTDELKIANSDAAVLQAYQALQKAVLQD